jgi:peptidyl-prolyl cis-trans isomerase C
MLCAICAFAQTAPPPAQPVPPAASPALPQKGDAVIAIFEDGTQMTVDQLKALIPALQPQYAQLAQQDWQKFLHYYGMMLKLSQMALDQKYDQRSPYKEGLAYARMSTLTDIMVREKMNSVAVPPEEVEKFYNEHKQPYEQVKVSAIYVAFGDNEDAASTGTASNAATHLKKGLTEEEAKMKASKLVVQARAGEDFKKLVKENSDDETSRDKGGDFGNWRIAENVPEVMRGAVFALKQGEVSDPVRQARGYYVFRADEITYDPLDKVRDSIFQQLKQVHAREWMQTVDTGTKVQFPNNNPAPPPDKK